MVDRGSQGFEVAPVAIGRGSNARRRRLRRLPVLLIIVAAVLVPSIAWIGPQLRGIPGVDLSFLVPPPTAVPSPTSKVLETPRPRSPLGTPLPVVTIVGAGPVSPIPINVGSVRTIDPATGALGPMTEISVEHDAVFAETDSDGWWCVCFPHRSDATGDAVDIAMRHMDGAGRTTSVHDIATYESSGNFDDDYYIRNDLEVTDDRRLAYVATGVRVGTGWLITIDTIDLVTERRIGHFELATLPRPTVDSAGSPLPDDTRGSLSGPAIRLSPDGRRLVVWAAMEAWSDSGAGAASVRHAWMIDVAGGPVDESGAGVTPLGGTFADVYGMCGVGAWLADDTLVMMCPAGGDTGPENVIAIRVFRPDGTETGHVDVPLAEGSWPADPLIDRANGFVYLWEPVGHVLHRVDLGRRREDILQVDPGIAQIAGSAQLAAPANRPDWATMWSDYRLYYGPQVIAEPGGSRVFAIGLVQSGQPDGMVPFGSSGVWVFETTDVSLLARWNPIAMYNSIGLTRDGKWLTAIGLPDVDEDGRPTQWQTSLTVHEVATGRPALRLGQLGGPYSTVMQVPP